MEPEQPQPSVAESRAPLLARLRALPVRRRRRLSLALAAGTTVAIAAAVAVCRAFYGADGGSFVESASTAAAVLGERFSGIIPRQF
jgi:hypothetical protein